MAMWLLPLLAFGLDPRAHHSKFFSKVKTILITILVTITASVSAFGWVIEKPIDYSDQLQKADFSGIVEVTSVIATGQKKLMAGYNVQFRELRLELKVLSAFKGSGETLRCIIYREPTGEELLADGTNKNEVTKILLNLGTDETLHLFPARCTKGAVFLVYLRADGSDHFPVTGDIDSSRSLLRVEPSSLVNTLTQKQEAQSDIRK